MKTQLIKLSVAVVAALGCMVNSAVAQQQRAIVQQQGGFQAPQGQSVQAMQGQGSMQSSTQQMRIGQPAFSPMPTPRLGFMGQMLYGYGMRVLSVNYGSVASQLGLERGDVIFSINGRRILSQADYSQALQNAAMYGGYVSLTVRNIRYDYGQSFQEFVYVNAYLPGYGGGFPVAGAVGPVGPRSIQMQSNQGQQGVVVQGNQMQNRQGRGGNGRIQLKSGQRQAIKKAGQIRSQIKEIARDKIPALKSSDVGSSQ